MRITRYQMISATGLLLVILSLMSGPALADGGGSGCSATINCHCSCSYWSPGGGDKNSHMKSTSILLGTRDVDGSKHDGTCYPERNHNGMDLCLSSYQTQCIDHCKENYGIELDTVNLHAWAAKDGSRAKRTLLETDRWREYTNTVY